MLAQFPPLHTNECRTCMYWLIVNQRTKKQMTTTISGFQQISLVSTHLEADQQYQHRPFFYCTRLLGQLKELQSFNLLCLFIPRKLLFLNPLDWAGDHTQVMLILLFFLSTALSSLSSSTVLKHFKFWLLALSIWSWSSLLFPHPDNPRKFCSCRGHKILPTLWEFELLVSSVSSLSLEAFVPAFLCPTSDSS